MSASPELNGDLVAVACVVEASILLASEWSRVLIEYVVPLLKRLNELHPTHQLCVAFVTYGAADTRPQPLLSKRYFAPLSHVTKELREEPSKLGIGQTSSGSGRGLSALEGLVAAIELFDILMASANFNANHAPTQSPQKDNRSLVAHLLHIAASPPDNAQRPQYNMLQHLDSVNWESIPAELRKRKINLSLISLKKIQHFLDIQSLVAGSGAQSPWFNVHAPHVLLLAGFPTPQKTGEETRILAQRSPTVVQGTKRQPDALVSDQSPDPKRQKLVAEPISKTASPALPSARIPPSRQQPLATQAAPPSSASVPSQPGQHSSPAQPVQPPASVSTSTPATASPAPPPPPGSSAAGTNGTLDLEVAQTGLKFSQMMDRYKMLEKDAPNLDAKIANAQATGQTAILAELLKERNRRADVKGKIQALLKQHYNKMLGMGVLNAQTNATVPNPPAEAGPSTQPVQPPNPPSTSNERPTAPSTDEPKLSVPDTQTLMQFWHSRGGTMSAPNSSNPQAGASQTQPHSSLTPEVAAQMQKPLEKKGIPPQSVGLFSQPLGVTSHEVGAASSSATNNQVVQSSNTNAWLGTFSGRFPRPGGQVTELQIYVAGILAKPTSIEISTDLWPKNLVLNLCREPIKDTQELSSWLKRHQGRSRLIQFKPNPRAPEGTMNERKFQALHKLMTEQRVFAYAGWQLPTGRFSYNMFIFPMGPSFAGAVFPDGLPDLPGNGNSLDVQPPVGETPPQQPLNGLPLPPGLLARMQQLEPAKQRQFIVYFMQEQLRRRQQSQHSQQAHPASSQAVNPLGMSIPQNPYTALTNMPTGLPANVNPPTNLGVYNTGSGTVNYEMMQSFMQRSADGSTSQGMNPGSMP